MNPTTQAYAITFSIDQLKVLNDALIELPVRLAMPVINTINEQISNADARAAAALDEERNRNRDESNALPPAEPGEAAQTGAAA